MQGTSLPHTMAAPCSTCLCTISTHNIREQFTVCDNSSIFIVNRVQLVNQVPPTLDAFSQTIKGRLVAVNDKGKQNYTVKKALLSFTENAANVGETCLTIWARVDDKSQN